MKARVSRHANHGQRDDFAISQGRESNQSIGPDPRPSRMMWSPSFFAAGSSGMLRLTSMVVRFSFSLYIVHYLGFRAMSSYGFVAAGTAGMIALSGLGLDYRIARSIISEDSLTAICHVRNRMILRMLVSSILISVGLCFLAAFSPGWVSASPSVIIIFFGEPITYDFQQALVSRRRPVIANVVLFIRSASWVPVIEALGIFLPSTRGIGWLFAGWAAGLIVATIFTGFFCIRKSLLLALIKEPIDWIWIRSSVFSARVVCISEIGTFAQIYNDRFIIAALVGREAAGLFIFIWTITNSLVPIVQASVFNRIVPILVGNWRGASLSAWQDVLREASKSIKIMGAVWVALLATAIIILLLTGRPLSRVGTLLAICMAIATVVRLQSDLLHQALYSVDRDSDWIAVNLVGLVIGPPLTALAVAALGLPGAAVQTLVLSSTLFLMRRKLLRLAVRDATLPLSIH